MTIALKIPSNLAESYFRTTLSPLRYQRFSVVFSKSKTYEKNGPKRQIGISSISTYDRAENLKVEKFLPPDWNFVIKNNMVFLNFFISIFSKMTKWQKWSK